MRNDRAESRKEEGCLHFDFVDLGGGKFAFYEVYKDAEAIRAHKATPHYKRCAAESNFLLVLQLVTERWVFTRAL